MMKKKFFQVFAAALTLISAGCSNDDLSGNLSGENESGKDAVYMNVTVKLPVGAGGRSSTKPEGGSTSGTEVGLDHENTVNSVMLVLAKTDNSFIGCAEKQESLTTEGDGTKVTAVQSISKSVLGAYYGTEGKLDDTQIRVFVFCNPTNALRIILEGTQKGSTTWYDQICTINESPAGTCDNAAIWGGAEHKQGFLMSSYEISPKNLPVNFSDWDKFTTADNPFKLSGLNTGVSGGGMTTEINNDGAIKVERSVARFDFKDGSGSANTYNVIYDKEDDKKCLVQIQLQRMALVNMSKNFFYLRRVSDNGLKTGEHYNLGGVETDKNYVVDTDADDKNGGKLANSEYANHFNFCLGHSDGDTWTIDHIARNQWFSSKIDDVLKGTEDNEKDDTWTSPSSKEGYRIWRYVTENTIPDPTSNQTNALSTGIVFKGKMIATENAKGTPLYDALNNPNTIVSPSDAILYAYGSDIYVRWTEVRAMAIKLGPASPMYKAVFGNTTVNPVAEEKEGEEIKVPAVYSNDENSADYLWNAWFYGSNKASDALLKFKKAATAANFTLYERSDDGAIAEGNYGPGYYCYYYYWNRHNDNGKPAIMGPMEFAVVRNNVYKLAVTSISRLGHPRISENDPDPKDPEDPDEEGDVYLSVSVEVLPWVVRINNIEF